MKKILKVSSTIIFTFAIIFSTLSFVFIYTVNPTFAADVQPQPVQIQTAPVAAPAPATVQPQATQSEAVPKTIPQKNAYKLRHTGAKYSALVKFTATMFWVLVSAAIIFLGLKTYQKIALKGNVKADKIDYEKSLESPKDFKEAINLFLDKTDK